MNKKDEKSIEFAANWYLNEFPEKYHIISSSTENYGFDFTAFGSNGNYLNPYMRPHLVEVKTFVSNKGFYEWERKSNDNYCFLYAPSKDKDLEYIKNEWKDKPTQEMLDEYKNKEDGTELSKNKRLYALNAASGRNFKISNNPKYQSKYYKISNSKLAQLVVIFKDGILFFSNDKLKEAFEGYGYMYERGYNWGKSEKYWQLKAFFNMDKGDFFPMEIPKELFENEIDHIKFL